MSIIRMDKLKVIAIIRRTLMEKPKLIVTGMKFGSSTLRLQAGEISIENLWETLLGLK